MVQCLLRDTGLLITGIKLNSSSKDSRIIAHKHPTRRHINLATRKLTWRCYTRSVSILRAGVKSPLASKSDRTLSFKTHLHRMYGALPPLIELWPHVIHICRHSWLHVSGYLSAFFFRLNHWSRNRNKFWEELTPYLLLIRHGPNKNEATNNFHIVAIRFRGTVFTQPLPSNDRRDTHSDTDWWEGFTKPMRWVQVLWCTYQVP
jgi:hypothetical protein